MSPSRRNTARIDEHRINLQLWSQYLVDKAFLCLTLYECMEPDHNLGLPPNTFFSQSSESE